jgi:hypothetical protein
MWSIQLQWEAQVNANVKAVLDDADMSLGLLNDGQHLISIIKGNVRKKKKKKKRNTTDSLVCFYFSLIRFLDYPLIHTI